MRAPKAEKPGDVRLRTASRPALSALAAAFLATAPLARGETPSPGPGTAGGTAGTLEAPGPSPLETGAPEPSAGRDTEPIELERGPGPTLPGSPLLTTASDSEPTLPEAADAEPDGLSQAEDEGREPDPAAEAAPAQLQDAQRSAASTPAAHAAPRRRPVVPDTYDSWAGLLESSLRDAGDSVPRGWRPGLAQFRVWAASLSGTWIGLALATAFLALLGTLRVLRRPGDLIVCVEYPSELRGSFSVELTKKRPSLERSQRGARDTRHRRASTPTLHCMVARETEFSRLRPRSYWIRLEGTLQSPDAGGSVMREHADTRCIDVRRGETVRLDFDLRPQGCPLDVKVLWDGKPVPDASVAVMGLPESLRYARGGTARLELPIGKHRVAAGSRDRVGELDVDIESHEHRSFTIELSGAEGIVFKGCPPAIEPYLLGELEAAAQALEREGQEPLAHTLLARFHEQSGEAERAADHYQTAGLYQDAGRLRASVSDFVGAATLFRQAGEAGSQDEAMRLLEQVQPHDSAYFDACLMLADLFECAGQLDEATAKLELGISGIRDEDRAAELRSRLAELLGRNGDDERSLEVLQQLQESKPDYPNLTTRIETLRKKLSAERTSDDPGETVVDPVRVTDSGSRYDILEQIGRGGMGVVFKARDRRLGRLVALKQLPENLRDHPTAAELFLREARAAAALNHQNIVTLFDADEEYGKFFITMELLEGSPVNKILRESGPVSAQVCARLGLQIAAGLEYAHGRGIVHRDIKSGNLFWTNDKVLKIMDFGLAKMIEEVRRSTTVIGGTPYYMAPEQISGKGVSARADIYALGVTLFELLTGSVPFPDGDVPYHHRHTPPPDPRSRSANVPAALASRILDMVEKQPELRCGSAAEVAQRLTPLAGEPS